MAGTSDCPECGAAVKLTLGPDDVTPAMELDPETAREEEVWVCPFCGIAWTVPGGEQFDAPMSSAGPSGFLSRVTAGAPADSFESTFRVLGFTEAGVLVRDCGTGVDWEAATRAYRGPMAGLDRQLGDTYAVVPAGYPDTVQSTINRLRPGYRVAAAIGPCEESGVGTDDPRDGAVDPASLPDEATHEFDAGRGMGVVEAVSVDYAIGCTVDLPLADQVWELALENDHGDAPFPSEVGTLTDDEDRPFCKLHVYPMEVASESGLPLLSGIRRGDLPHLELFLNDPSDQLHGPLVDVVVAAPEERPYFAVSCISAAGAQFSHDLRRDLGLQVVHRGTETSRREAFDVRFDARYLDRWRKHGHDRLYEWEGDGYIDVETGHVEDTGAISMRPVPNELVYTVTEEGREVEIARLRRPDDDESEG